MSLMENTEQYWKINKKWPKRIFWFIFALSLLCARLLPGYGNYTNRARVSEVLVLLQAPRMSVEEQLKKNPNSKVILDAQTCQWRSKCTAGAEQKCTSRHAMV